MPSESRDREAPARAEFDRALALGAAGDHAGAEAALRELLRRDPGHRAATATLAQALAESARPGAAADVVLHGVEHAALGPLEAATFLRRCLRFEDACRICESALATRSGDARLHSLAGTLALNLGRFDAAFEHLRAALAIDPADAAAWLRIAHTRRFTRADDPALALLEAGERRTTLPPAAREAIGFALGKAWDELGRHAEAAERLRAANASYRARVPWSAHAWQDAVETLRAQRWTGQAETDAEFRPIFVVGLPRTGTTLVARLLERRFGARNRGETPWVAETARRLGAPPASARALDAAAHFLVRNLRQDDARVRWYLDKNPLNFRHVHLIRALLPQARIVWMRRDARDTALSSWMQHFAHPDTGYAYAWSDIAAFFEGHDRLFEDARADPGDTLMELRYEELVADTPAALQRVAAFLGEEPVAEVATGAADSVIATASLWQARQPVHTGSVGRWRHYRDAIPELSERFGDR